VLIYIISFIPSLALPDFPQSDTESEEETEEKDRNAVSETAKKLANTGI